MKIISWLDNTFTHLAKYLIAIAAFFGISRRLLMNGWIMAAIACNATYDYFHSVIVPLLNPLMTIMITITLIIGGILLLAMNASYRDDDVLPNAGPEFFRITVMATYLLPDLCHSILILPLPWFLLMYFLKSISPFFRIYILLNQSPQNPLRLRNLLRGWARSLRSALQHIPRIPEPAHALSRPLVR